MTGGDAAWRQLIRAQVALMNAEMWMKDSGDSVDLDWIARLDEMTEEEAVEAMDAAWRAILMD